MAVPSINSVPTDTMMTGSGAPGSQTENAGENFDRVFAAAKPPVKEEQGEPNPQEMLAVLPLFRGLLNNQNMETTDVIDTEVPADEVDSETPPESPKLGLFNPDMILALEFASAHQQVAGMAEQNPLPCLPDGEVQIVSESVMDNESEIVDPALLAGDDLMNKLSKNSNPTSTIGEKGILSEDIPSPKDGPTDFSEALLTEKAVSGEGVSEKESVPADQRQSLSAKGDHALPLMDETLIPKNFRRFTDEKRNTLKTGVNVEADRPTIDKRASDSAESLPTQPEKTVSSEGVPAKAVSLQSEMTDDKGAFAKDALQAAVKGDSVLKDNRESAPIFERPTRTFSVTDILANMRVAMQGPTVEAARTEIAPAAPSAAVADFFGDNALGRGVQAVLEFLKNEGVTQARMVVDPPALGRIDVSLQTTANGIEATFRVDNEQLRQVLQNQLDQLKQSLQAQGIHVSGLSVDIRGGDEKDRTGTAAKKLKRSGGIEGADDELTDDSAAIRLDLEKGLLHWVG